MESIEWPGCLSGLVSMTHVSLPVRDIVGSRTGLDAVNKTKVSSPVGI